MYGVWGIGAKEHFISHLNKHSSESAPQKWVYFSFINALHILSPMIEKFKSLRLLQTVICLTSLWVLCFLRPGAFTTFVLFSFPGPHSMIQVLEACCGSQFWKSAVQSSPHTPPSELPVLPVHLSHERQQMLLHFLSDSLGRGCKSHTGPCSILNWGNSQNF